MLYIYYGTVYNHNFKWSADLIPIQPEYLVISDEMLEKVDAGDWNNDATAKPAEHTLLFQATSR